MADRGSRAWSGGSLIQWTNDMVDWSEQVIPSEFRKIYKPQSPYSSGSHSPTHPDVYISAPFCTRHGLNWWLPANDPERQSIQLTMFAVSSWRSDILAAPLRFETIRAKLSHVSWCHQLVYGFRPQLLPGHQLAFNGMQRLSPPQRRREAVTTTILTRIAQALDLSIAQHRVICGAAVLGFFFCLRGSEFLSSNGGRHAYCIKTSDVEVLDAAGLKTARYDRAQLVRLTIRASKTDQQGMSIVREMLKAPRPPVCPVFAALLLLKNAEAICRHRAIPLCSIAEGEMLSTTTMARTLRWAARREGLDHTTISTHSLRAGGASALHGAGATIDTIKMYGRWASSAYQRYIVQPSTRTLDLTARMTKQLNQAAPLGIIQEGRTVATTVQAARR